MKFLVIGIDIKLSKKIKRIIKAKDFDQIIDNPKRFGFDVIFKCKKWLNE